MIAYFLERFNAYYERFVFLFYLGYYSFKSKKLIKVRRKTSDFSIFRQIFIKKEYDFDLGFEPVTIIDAGANVGYASLWFAIKFKNSRIIAIEPEESNYSVLSENVSSFKRIIPLKFALWYKETKLNIFDTGYDHWGYAVRESKSHSIGSTPTITINKILTKYNLEKIDLLKIDIEGAEKELFEKGSQLWINKVSAIFIELHDRMKPGCTKALNKIILKNNFKVYKSGEYLVLLRGKGV